MILAKPSLFPPIKEIVFFGKRALNNPAPGVSREGRTGASSPKHLYFYTLKEIVLFRKRALMVKRFTERIAKPATSG